MKNTDQIEQLIGVKFRDHKLLERAFTHRSYLNEHPKLKLEHNERLEFLGDAVLELAVTRYLYDNFFNPEGELTNWRSALVKTESLAAISAGMGLGNYLMLSRGEDKGGGRTRKTLLANVFEALLGAIYLDQGYEAAEQFVHQHVLANLEQILKSKSYIDPKSRFQELAQDQEGVTPSYKVLAESGPDHNKHFVIGVYVGRRLYGRGEGPSKQAGQQAAAADALRHYGKPSPARRS